jgi:hypothetical protein
MYYYGMCKVKVLFKVSKLHLLIGTTKGWQLGLGLGLGFVTSVNFGAAFDVTNVLITPWPTHAIQ